MPSPQYLLSSPQRKLVITLKSTHPSAGFALKGDFSPSPVRDVHSASQFSVPPVCGGCLDQNHVSTGTRRTGRGEQRPERFATAPKHQTHLELVPKYIVGSSTPLTLSHLEPPGSTCRSATGAATVPRTACSPFLRPSSESQEAGDEPSATYICPSAAAKPGKNRNGHKPGHSPRRRLVPRGARRAGGTAEPSRPGSALRRSCHRVSPHLPTPR